MKSIPDEAYADLEHFVEPADLATQWKNDVPVLATPVLLWLAEITCMDVLRIYLESDEMSVGVGHEVRHLAPTPEGFNVKVIAKFLRTQGRLVEFSVSATDGAEMILEGTHTRAIISRGRFLDRIEKKSGQAT